MVKILNTGPRIGQLHLLLIILVLLIAALYLSAYQKHKIDEGRLFCARLNQRTASELVWNGEGCLMKGRVLSGKETIFIAPSGRKD